METKKLTAKDIMIGDYMKYKDGTIVQIARIGDVSPMDAPIYCHTQLEGYFPCQLDDISPISITAEFLEKNCWYIPENCSWWQNNEVNFFIIGYTDGQFEVCTDIDSEFSNLCCIENVNELQHLYHICHIDKEIVL